MTNLNMDPRQLGPSRRLIIIVLGLLALLLCSVVLVFGAIVADSMGYHISDFLPRTATPTQVGDDIEIQIPISTATPVPTTPTRTPTQLAPTTAPTRAPTIAPAATNTLVPATQTPTPIPALPTVAPPTATQTASPTRTPLPTATATATATPLPTLVPLRVKSKMSFEAPKLTFDCTAGSLLMKDTSIALDVFVGPSEANLAYEHLNLSTFDKGPGGVESKVLPWRLAGDIIFAYRYRALGLDGTYKEEEVSWKQKCPGTTRQNYKLQTKWPAPKWQAVANYIITPNCEGVKYGAELGFFFAEVAVVPEGGLPDGSVFLTGSTLPNDSVYFKGVWVVPPTGKMKVTTTVTFMTYDGELQKDTSVKTLTCS